MRCLKNWQTVVFLLCALHIVSLIVSAAPPAQSLNGNDLFVTPEHLVAFNRESIRRQNWYGAFRCYSPEARGVILLDMFATKELLNDRTLSSIVQKHCKATLKEVCGPALTKVGDRVEVDRLRLYEILKKRTDLPAFVAEFFARCHEVQRDAPFSDFAVEGKIEVKQDRAVGRYKLDPASVRGSSTIHPAGAPTGGPGVPERPTAEIWFRKIGESWYFDMPESENQQKREPASGVGSGQRIMGRVAQ